MTGSDWYNLRMARYQKIYFMGIKGVGMATLAVISKQAGFLVSGSDVEEKFITDKILDEAGIDVRIGFKKENPEDFFNSSPKDECLFIATAAHEGFNNEEVVWAKDNGIKIISHGEAVGLFMDGDVFDRKFEGISIAGAHGKTTIAGMIASCLTKLGSDPSFTVGTSEIFPTGPAGHFGSGKYFIAEADEYFSEPNFDKRPKFLYQKPKYLIINNIDFDHPDVYPNLESVVTAYREFIENVSQDGLLIVNGDDEKIKKLIANSQQLKAIKYGTDAGNEFVIKNFREEGLSSRFEVLRNGTSLGNFELSIPGYHNAKNSLAVIALLCELGISINEIQKVLPEFKGAKRRLEKIGETGEGVLIFDDYAHHPEEIRKSIEALKSAYPDKKITLVFQAHTYSRTKALFKDFVGSFGGVFELIILPTFASARDAATHTVSEDEDFVESIRLIQPRVVLIKDLPSVVEYIQKNVQGPDRVVVTMGAGDVYKVAEQLTN